MHDTLGEVLAKRRVKAVLPHIKGRLLDVGCGSNRLVRHYADGVGVDVYPWPGADVIVNDTAALQWKSESFDTVTIVAALNHIPNRVAVLNECRRVLKPGGRLIITMLTPRTSRIWPASVSCTHRRPVLVLDTDADGCRFAVCPGPYRGRSPNPGSPGE